MFKFIYIFMYAIVDSMEEYFEEAVQWQRKYICIYSLTIICYCLGF